MGAWPCPRSASACGTCKRTSTAKPRTTAGSGIISFGGVALGLIAIGRAACGLIAIGGGALGYVAIGGAGRGVYVLAGFGKGRYVFDGRGQHPRAVEFFCKYVPRLRQAFVE
jgi:hypothetical protein